jgi:predicted permease
VISFGAIFQAILPVFLIMGTGFAIRRTGFISAKADEALMKLSIHLFLPALILDKVIGNERILEGGIVLPATGLGCLFILIGITLSYFTAPLLGLRPGSGQRTFSLAAGIQNYGFMAIPVMASILPAEQFDNALAVLFVHSLGIELATWTVGISVLKGARAPQWRLLANGPVIAIAIGLTLNYSGTHTYVPAAFGELFHALGLCAIPLGLLLVGASIADLLTPGSLSGAKRTFLGSCLLRLAVIPALILLAAASLDLPIELRQVLVVQAAMPAAVFPIILARHYGGHPVTAVQVVIATTLMSVLTIPLVIALAIHLGLLGV